MQIRERPRAGLALALARGRFATLRAYILAACVTAVGLTRAGVPVSVVESPGSFGSERSAGAEGLVLSYPDGTDVSLAAGSRFTLVGQERVWPASAQAASAQVLDLVEGELKVKLPAAPVNAFLVRTSQGLQALLVAGTLKVRALAGGARVLNETGMVWVTDDELPWQPVARGGAVRFRGDAGGLSFSGPPAQPKWRPSTCLWVALDGVALTGDISWSPVAGAKGYRVLVTDASGRQTTRLSQRPTLDSGLGQVPSGTYRLVVRAVLDGDFQGPPSDELSVHVVGVAKGDSVEVLGPRRLRLNGGRRVVLRGADGLLMSIGNAGQWLPTAGSVTLRDRAQMDVLLKHPVTGEVVNLQLVAAQPPATIRVAPKGLSWPGKPLEVSVDYASEAHVSDAPRVEAFIGLRRFALELRGQEGSWSASIPAPRGKGPWVVRVQLKDEQGRIVARDFAEVSKRQED